MRSFKTIGLIGFWLVFLAFVTFLFTRTVVGGYDFRTYYVATEKILNHEDLYTGFDGGNDDYIYPPILAQVITPFSAVMDYDSVALVWHGANILLLFLTVILLNRTTTNQGQRRVFWLMPLLFTPVIQGFWVGQVSFVLLACFTAAWYLYKQNRHDYAGAMLALAAWIKVYPALLLLYFVLRRDWRVVRGAAIGGILIGLLQILFSGFNTMMDYLTVILPGLASQGQATGMFKNNSILGFAYRLFTDTKDIAPLVDNPALVSPTRIIITLIVVGLSLFVLLRKRNNDDSERLDLEYSLVLVVALLLGSILWVSSIPVILLAYYLVLRNSIRGISRLIVWISFGIVSFYFPMLLAIQPGNKLSVWVLSVGFYGVMLLWGFIVYRLYNKKERTGVRP